MTSPTCGNPGEDAAIIGADEVKAHRAARKAARRAAHAPERDLDYAHLTLHDLRTLRSALRDELAGVDYWCRIISARLKAHRTGGRLRAPVADLTGELRHAENVIGRLSALGLPPADDLHAFPDLAGIWAGRPDTFDIAALVDLVADLEFAADELAKFRSAILRRCNSVTGDLIARYREDPRLALTALPGDSSNVSSFATAL
jgi:hypothetical protein